MASPTTEANIRVDRNSGVGIKEAQHLIIHVDDVEAVLGQMLSQFSKKLNDTAAPGDQLGNLSHQFFLSRGMPIDQVVGSILGLIARAPSDCKVGIVLDHDQDGYTGAEIARLLNHERAAQALTNPLTIVAFTGRAKDLDVVEAWRDLADVLYKADMDRDMIEQGKFMLKKLFPG